MLGRCSLIYPWWVPIGWVKWQGSATEERLFMTERKRCHNDVEAPNCFGLCPEHVAEVEAGRLFAEPGRASPQGDQQKERGK